MILRLTARYTLVLCYILVAAGCSQTLSPLYADFPIDEKVADEEDFQALVESAVLDAGWTLKAPDAPNAVSTNESTVAHWGLYKVVVSLDVVPVNRSHVRVFVHPYRVYVWGSRSKMLYMSRRVRNHVVPDIREAFESSGILAVDVEMASDTSS